jgi:RNA polymerase sigma-70 factor (ECF subfamily)
MYAVAFRMLGDHSAAQDSLQKAFLSAFQEIHRFEERSQFETWLHRIVVNAALGWMRSARRRPEVPLSCANVEYEVLDHASGLDGEVSPTPEEALLQRESDEAVARLVDRLPQTYRLVVVRRDVEGRSLRETADTLGITAGAVKSRLHRARAVLREYITVETAIAAS